MRKLIHLGGTSAIVIALALALPAMAGARSATQCDGALAPGTYKRVVVPEGATCLSDGPVRITAGLFVEAAGTFVLGDESQPGINGRISGGVHATRPASVRIHFVRIDGGLDIRGGSGPFGGPFGITWIAIEDNQINGGATVRGYDGFWFGFIRNHVNGTVTLVHNVVDDPDGNEYVTNTIHGSLVCFGNSPAPQIGDSEGSPNLVTGAKKGQCAGL